MFLSLFDSNRSAAQSQARIPSYVAPPFSSRAIRSAAFGYGFKGLILWFLVTLPTASASAQEMMMLDDESTLVLPELAAVAEMTGEELKIKFPLPAEMRPAANRQLDIQRGDTILMIAGKRIRDLAAARQAYGSVEVGSEMAIAVERGADRRIVRFEKMPETSLEEMLASSQESGEPGHGGGMVISHTLDMEDGAMPQPFPRLGVLAREGESASGVEVMMVLPVGEIELETGDLIVALNDQEVADGEALKKQLEALDIGAEVEIKVIREGQEQVLRQGVVEAEIRTAIGGGR